MAMLISRATGNFTAAATWGVADSATGSQLTNPSASTNTTTSYVYSNAFTGTNTRVADGIALFLKRLNTTGTVTVALSDDNGVTATRSVTVNASDLPADESWVFFKFGSTLTLDGGTDYRVGVVASDADNALIYRNATAGNWARMVSTTLTAAPAATDTMLIVGEWTGAGVSSSYTVTMDNTNTTTDFGTGVTSNIPTSQTSISFTFNGMQVGQNGTLTWGTSAATNYYLRISGHIIVWSGGAYNMGTSGTPCPRDSTMTLQFDSTGTGNSSFGLATFNGSVINIYGQSRTAGKDIFYCNLTANAAANATSLSVDTDTGWLDNDQICISATNRIVTEDERGTLNGTAGASTLTVDGFGGTAGGLAFSHDGTGIACAVVCLLTRNVKITGTNNGGFVICRGTSAVNFRWAEFTAMGGQSNAGVGMPATSGINIQYCSFHTSTSGSFMGGSTGVMTNATLSNNVIYNFGDNINISSVSVGSTGNVISNSFFMKPVFTSCLLMQTANYHFTMSNCFFSGGSTAGLNLTAFNSNQQISNCRVQCCGTGVNVNFSVSLLSPITLSGLTIARCTTSGIGVNGHITMTFENLLIAGCTTQSFLYNSLQGSVRNFVSCTMTGESAYPTVNNITIPNNSFVGIINITNCNFSLSSGSYAPATNDISIGTFANTMITASNTLFGAATEILNPSNMGAYGFVKSSKHDQTEGAFKSWFQGGVIERDTTIFNTAAPSERLTPSSATIKLASGPRLVAVDDGNTITINAYVRKSATGDGAEYNGNQPRLIVKANPAAGITTDTVLDTMTVGTGTWEQLTGTTAAVDADGALEFYVDCDGTAGWINVDDWTVT